LAGKRREEEREKEEEKEEKKGIIRWGPTNSGLVVHSARTCTSKRHREKDRDIFLKEVQNLQQGAAAKVEAVMQEYEDNGNRVNNRIMREFLGILEPGHRAAVVAQLRARKVDIRARAAR